MATGRSRFPSAGKNMRQSGPDIADATKFRVARMALHGRLCRERRGARSLQDLQDLAGAGACGT